MLLSPSTERILANIGPATVGLAMTVPLTVVVVGDVVLIVTRGAVEVVPPFQVTVLAQ